MTRDQLLNRIGNGRFCTIVFKKSDGSIRTANGLFGVKKHLKGGVKPYDDSMHNLVTIYDLRKGGYISIPCHRIISVRANGSEVKE